jgi:glycosyltransferase involved in cell wall biosynthesis
MQASDVLLVTSVHESGPLMVKEALACNLRVVSLDVGDVRETIEGLPGCEVCADDRPSTIASALARSLSTESCFDGRSAVNDMLQDALANRLVKIYERLATRHGGSASLR